MADALKLLRCPFCAAPADAVSGPVPGRWGVLCDACDVFQDSRSPSREEAISVWNRRSIPSPETMGRLSQRVDELEDTRATFCVDYNDKVEHDEELCRCTDLALLRDLLREIEGK